MDNHNARVKMAAKLLLDYLLEHREALKVMLTYTDQHFNQQQPGKEETAAPDPLRSAP